VSVPRSHEEPPVAVAAKEAPVAPASPEGFRLDVDPPRVMRLSRRTLAIAGGVAGTAIGGALLWALQPGKPRAPENLYRVDSRNRADVVTGAPADYGAVPKLGPALPGDLGRPIVSAQRRGEAAPAPPTGSPPSPPRDPVAEARERAAQERAAAQSSRLFLGTNAGGAMREAGGEMQKPPLVEPAPPQPGEPASAAAGRRAFLDDGRRRSAETGDRIRQVTSPNVIQAGSIIPAALITGIRSDLPGQVTAQVTQNVYDSPTGRILLIPQGARLVGEYDSEIGAGQDRVQLAWDRLILPGGRSIRLARQPGADAAGMAGLSDRTDYHWGGMLRAALVSTLLGVGADLGTDSDERLARALRDGSQDTINQTGRQLVERELGAAPTLTIRPGFPLRVIVTRDLVMEEGEKGAGR
jgi:type IV secretory pathway VirB10-like protein